MWLDQQQDQPLTCSRHGPVMTWLLADAANGKPTAASLLSSEAQQRLHDITELDYMTHIVFRMYENKR